MKALARTGLAAVALSCATCAPALVPSPAAIAPAAPPAAPAVPQAAAVPHPSPMVDFARAHERLVQRELPGTRRTFLGPVGKPVEVLVPPLASSRDSLDLVVHFHGAAWLPLQAISALGDRIGAAVNLGVGSSAYRVPFTDPAAFDTLLAAIAREASAVAGHPVRIGRVTLSGFSAGYGAVRAILTEPRHFARVSAVLLLDGIHASYVPEGRPLADGGAVDSMNVVTFAAFARAAARGEKRFLISHSEIFPGSYASTTESTDWLLTSLGLRRTPVLQWGPRGMQQLSEVLAGGFEVLGFAGTSAPDHIDQVHAMPELLARLLGR